MPLDSRGLQSLVYAGHDCFHEILHDNQRGREHFRRAKILESHLPRTEKKRIEEVWLARITRYAKRDLREEKKKISFR